MRSAARKTEAAARAALPRGAKGLDRFAARRLARRTVSPHYFLPLERPVLAPGADHVRVRELGPGDLLLGGELARGELGGQLDARARGTAEVRERPFALDRRVEPPVEELIGELLVLRAHGNAGDVEEADHAFLGNDHLERQPAIDVIARARAPVGRDPYLAVLEVRHRFRRSGDDHADVGLLRLEPLPGGLHVVDATLAELRRVDEGVDRQQVRRVVLDDVALHLVAVFFLRLPIVVPGARPLELFLVIDERRVLQRVRRAASRGDDLPRLVPEIAHVRHFALAQLLEHALLHAEDDLGRREEAGDVEPRRAARGADLGVVLRGGAGGVMDDLDAELLLERPDDDALDQLLVFAALRVDDQRFLRAGGDDVGCRHRGGGALQQPSA